MDASLKVPYVQAMLLSSHCSSIVYPNALHDFPFNAQLLFRTFLLSIPSFPSQVGRREEVHRCVSIRALLKMALPLLYPPPMWLARLRVVFCVGGFGVL